MNRNECIHGRLKRQCQECDQIAEIEELRAKVAELEKDVAHWIVTAIEEAERGNELAEQIAELEAKHEAVEPVGYVNQDSLNGFINNDLSPMAVFRRSHENANIPLYTQPPSTQAAVAAALRKAAEKVPNTYVGVQNAILALPYDDSHLREVCMRVAREIDALWVEYEGSEILKESDFQEAVDRVLKGETK